MPWPCKYIAIVNANIINVITKHIKKIYVLKNIQLSLNVLFCCHVILNDYINVILI